jgi:hypothetical protein
MNKLLLLLNHILQILSLLVLVIYYYQFLTIFEWLGHKYIMHCDKKSFFYNLLSKIDPNKVIEQTCDNHIQHHKEVKPNMYLNSVKLKESLFMGWNVFLYIFIFSFASLCISKIISQNKLPYIHVFIYSICLTLLWSYIWNKVHPLMHKYEGSYNIKEGPYESTLNFNSINKLFYRNHEYHHLQKGNKKGNYNIIVFGADEWLGTNVQIIDNKEYCSNPQVANEEICLSK